MATPHVAGVAGLLWMHFPDCKNYQIRNVLAATAMDLGSTDGCDNQYGYGLVQAKKAYELLAQGNCGGDIGTDEPVGGCEQLYPEPNCEADSDCDDGDVCTVDTCENGQCVSTPNCSSCGKSKVDVEITIDNYGEETAYDIKDSSGTKVMNGSGWPSNSVNSFWKCLSSGSYTFTITDGYGDGLCCSYGNGGYSVKVEDKEVASGGQFGSSETKPFDVAVDPPSSSPISQTPKPSTATATFVPTQLPTSTGSAIETFAPTNSGCAIKTFAPTGTATEQKTFSPTGTATEQKTFSPTGTGTEQKTLAPTSTGTEQNTTFAPTLSSSSVGTEEASSSGSSIQTFAPTSTGSASSTSTATEEIVLPPTSTKSNSPTEAPTLAQTAFPTQKMPTLFPSGIAPTPFPTEVPLTSHPTETPPTAYPTNSPPTSYPTETPPTLYPTQTPPTDFPTYTPPTMHPTQTPPTLHPTQTPPTPFPTENPPTPFPTETPPTSFPTQGTCKLKGEPCTKASDCCKNKCNTKKQICKK